MKFELNNNQLEKYNKWLLSRPNKEHAFSPIGGRFTFCFTPCDLGVTCLIIDSMDKPGTELDLTEFPLQFIKTYEKLKSD